MLDLECGIYSITIPSGKVYFGQSKSMKRRWRWHLYELRTGVHYCRELQEVFDRDGVSSIVFAKMAIVPLEDLNWREKEQIDACPKLMLLNQRPPNMRQIKRGDMIPKELRDRLYSRKGKLISDTHRANLSASLKGGANPNSRKILCVDLNRTFESISIAIEYIRSNGRLKAAQSGISRACLGEAATAFGYKWRYADAEEH